MIAGEFAAIAIALYVAHHVGDYWVQTDWQAKHKGEAGWIGRAACMRHVTTYYLTQLIALFSTAWLLGIGWRWGMSVGLAVSAVTHYMADRREHGLMIWLARRIPGKAAFLELGKPRGAHDNPQLATGAWALDQSWHLAFGVFVPALLAVTL